MARGSSQRGSRNKRKYSGGQTDERKQQILKKLRALKERKENTRKVALFLLNIRVCLFCIVIYIHC